MKDVIKRSLNETFKLNWVGEKAYINGLQVGKINLDPDGWRYELLNAPQNSTCGVRARARDARRAVELVWRDIIAKETLLADASVESERFAFFANTDGDGRKLAVADSIICDLADQYDISVRYVAALNAWRYAGPNGAQLDLHWFRVRSLRSPELVNWVLDAVAQLIRTRKSTDLI